MSSDEKLTFRRWLTEEVAVYCVRKQIPYDTWTLIEAVSSTALEHPEWDMDEVRTREEWERERRISRPGP